MIYQFMKINKYEFMTNITLTPNWTIILKKVNNCME